MRRAAEIRMAMPADWEMSALRHEVVPAGAAISAEPGPLWVVILDGEATLETVDVRVVLRAGDATLVDGRTAYRLAATAETELVHADLRLVSPLPGLPSPLVVTDYRAHHRGVADLLSGCPLGGECRPADFAGSYAALIGATMIASWRASHDDENQPAPDTQVADVVAALVAQPGEAWNVDRMAGLVHVSRSAFTERFRHATGRSPMQVLREVRMRHARQLLAEKSVTRVAFETGYGSVAAFSRAFAIYHGVSPQAWRASISGRKPQERPA